MVMDMDRSIDMLLICYLVTRAHLVHHSLCVQPMSGASGGFIKRLSRLESRAADFRGRLNFEGQMLYVMSFRN